MAMKRWAPALALAIAVVLSGCGKKSDQADAQQKLADAEKQLADAQKQVDAAKAAAQQSGAPAPGTGGGFGSPAQPGQAAPAAPPPPKVVTIPAGTTIAVRTITSLSTKTAQNGTPFSATLQEPLSVDGELIAAKGAEVGGVVAHSDSGGRVKGKASIAVALRTVNSEYGKLGITTGSVGVEARSTVKKDVTRGAIMTGAGAAIGAIAGGGRGAAIGAGVGGAAGVGTAMATKGAAAEIPAESVLTFKLSAPVTVTLQK
ncbi:MAG: hypothetical protein HY821_12475 [Acidobacteria bacterium]|nr:hypothetical protein [Acidobacteriota bacterium]